MTEEEQKQQTKQFVHILRSLANEIEKGEKTLGVAVAWVMQTEPEQLTHSAFSIHQRLGRGSQLNAWRSEASRIMGLMDAVDQQIAKASGPRAMIN